MGPPIHQAAWPLTFRKNKSTSVRKFSWSHSFWRWSLIKEMLGLFVGSSRQISHTTRNLRGSKIPEHHQSNDDDDLSTATKGSSYFWIYFDTSASTFNPNESLSSTELKAWKIKQRKLNFRTKSEKGSNRVDTTIKNKKYLAIRLKTASCQSSLLHHQSSHGTRNSHQYKHRLVADLYDDLAVVYPIHIDLSQGVKMLKIKSWQDGVSCLRRIEIFPPISIVISHCGRPW